MSKIIEVKNLIYDYPIRSTGGNHNDKRGDVARDTDDLSRVMDSDINSSLRALDGVSFDVEEGEFVAVIGRNGSGKSTLAKCLNALYMPGAGDVYIKGWNSRDEAHLWKIRETAGMVFQNPDNQIVSSIVEDDVAFGPENLGVAPVNIRKRVDAALSAVGMKDAAKKAPHLLSGGQKQRIAIAGALAMRPEIIIFDEPTAMLDPAGRKEIMKIIAGLHDDGITVILITHFMDEAAQADRVIVMEEGKVSFDDSPKNLFNNKEFIDKSTLDPPIAVELAAKLRAIGVSLPEGIVSTEELADVLAGFVTKQ